MAEFSELVRTKIRICAKYKNSDCTGCPIPDLCGIISISCYDNIDFQKLEGALLSWAAEHPVVYPTWWEWLASIGAVTRKVKPDVASKLIDTGLLDEIPADMAQKLGIEPKEGV